MFTNNMVLRNKIAKVPADWHQNPSTHMQIYKHIPENVIHMQAVDRLL